MRARVRRSQPGKMTAAPPLCRTHCLMKPLDEIDRKLVALLQDNARTSTVALAKSVGLSRSTVQERLHRLETAGVIAQYTVRLGQGGDPFQAWLLLLQVDTPTALADLRERIVAFKGVDDVTTVPVLRVTLDRR